mmetsp:Transcript_16692/g.34445  ORF Transcript_16692/g.34445 Transcript_16692/m.34445 type:complete len:200 (-) Transcript_16692:365-964(-)
MILHSTNLRTAHGINSLLTVTEKISSYRVSWAMQFVLLSNQTDCCKRPHWGLESGIPVHHCSFQCFEVAFVAVVVDIRRRIEEALVVGAPGMERQVAGVATMRTRRRPARHLQAPCATCPLLVWFQTPRLAHHWLEPGLATRRPSLIERPNSTVRLPWHPSFCPLRQTFPFSSFYHHHSVRPSFVELVLVPHQLGRAIR